jgi:hypothetical protein
MAIHKTVPLQVWVDVGEGIAGIVNQRRRWPISTRSPEFAHLNPAKGPLAIEERFEIDESGDGWSRLYLKCEMDKCEGCERSCAKDDLCETDDMVNLCPECYESHLRDDEGPRQ